MWMLKLEAEEMENYPQLVMDYWAGEIEMTNLLYHVQVPSTEYRGRISASREIPFFCFF
jgi:hypothetical protein